MDISILVDDSWYQNQRHYRIGYIEKSTLSNRNNRLYRISDTSKPSTIIAIYIGIGRYIKPCYILIISQNEIGFWSRNTFIIKVF